MPDPRNAAPVVVSAFEKEPVPEDTFLRVLRDAGLVEVRPDAQRRLYRVRAAPLQTIDEWLEPYRSLWRERLDGLERHLNTLPLDGV